MKGKVLVTTEPSLPQHPQVFWMLSKRQGFFLWWPSAHHDSVLSLCSIIFTRNHFHMTLPAQLKQSLELARKWWALATCEPFHALIGSLADCPSSANLKSLFSAYLVAFMPFDLYLLYSKNISPLSTFICCHYCLLICSLSSFSINLIFIMENLEEYAVRIWVFYFVISGLYGLVFDHS